MTAIRESRYTSIEYKIITLEDIKRLATVLTEEYSRDPKEKERSSISFMVGCADNSSFESADCSIFNPDSFLAKKRILSVSMSLHRYLDDAYINIELCHGNYGSNYIKVRGTNSTWVNGITSQLSEITDSFKPQSGLVRNHPHILGGVLALGYGCIFIWIVDAIPVKPLDDPPEWARLIRALFDKIPLLRMLFRYVFGMLAGYFPASLTKLKLSELWPSIEIQIGPEHLYIEKKRRKWIGAILVAAVLPLLLSLIYDIIKAIWM